MIDRHPGLSFLELGRSCVLSPYRTKRTVELLWHGVWSYVLTHGAEVMIGCASLEGTDPRRLATQLAFLHHYARAPEEWRGRALHQFGTTDVLIIMPVSALNPRYVTYYGADASRHAS